MKKSIHTIGGLAAMMFGFTSVSANAALILTYDSNSTGVGAADVADTVQLEAIDNANTSPNTAFVASNSATTFTSAGTVARNTNNQEIVSDRAGVNTAGTGDDISFNFGGTGTVFSTADNPLTVANIDSNPFLGFDFVAAQTLTLDSLSFNLFVNSGAGGFGARDVGLFVSLDDGVFTQFGSLVDNNGTGNQGVVTFSQADFNVASGQEVELRLLFTDKTNSTALNGNIQGGTRVGNIQVFATAVPEPSSTTLLGLGVLGLLARRKR